jgi:hypothetical protein
LIWPRITLMGTSYASISSITFFTATVKSIR